MVAVVSGAASEVVVAVVVAEVVGVEVEVEISVELAVNQFTKKVSLIILKTSHAQSQLP